MCFTMVSRGERLWQLQKQTLSASEQRDFRQCVACGKYTQFVGAVAASAPIFCVDCCIQAALDDLSPVYDDLGGEA